MKEAYGQIERASLARFLRHIFSTLRLFNYSCMEQMEWSQQRFIF